MEITIFGGQGTVKLTLFWETSENQERGGLCFIKEKPSATQLTHVLHSAFCPFTDLGEPLEVCDDQLRNQVSSDILCPFNSAVPVSNISTLKTIDSL